MNLRLIRARDGGEVASDLRCLKFLLRRWLSSLGGQAAGRSSQVVAPGVSTASAILRLLDNSDVMEELIKTQKTS